MILALPVNSEVQLLLMTNGFVELVKFPPKSIVSPAMVVRVPEVSVYPEAKLKVPAVPVLEIIPPEWVTGLLNSTDPEPLIKIVPLAMVKGLLLIVILDRKSTRLNSSHLGTSYAVF